MREAWRKITIKGTKFSVFLVFGFGSRDFWFFLCVLQLLVKFCKVILDSKVIKGIEKGDLFVVKV